MNKKSLIAITLFCGVIIGALSMFWFSQEHTLKDTTGASNEAKPLYWVAPMDANFRRDKAGLSPMGMALVPVYESSGESDAGVVVISPTIVNNLGVRTAAVTFDALKQIVRTTGAVGFDDEKRVDIHPRVEGWIEKLHVKSMGDSVQKGQPLYDIYSPELVNAQEELVLAVEQANRHLISAASRRLDALLVPKQTIKVIKETRKVSNSLTIYSPISGIIDAIYVREGGFIKPATQLMSISALEQVWVTVDIFESQAKQINVGDMAMMTTAAFGDKEWHAVVDKIYPMLNQSTRTLQVRLRIDNSDYALKPNMYANVSVHSMSAEKAMLVPNEAVIRTGLNNRVVMALGNGKFKSIAVEIGRSNDKLTQVLSGLQSGDEVVVSAQFLIDSESNIASDLMRYNEGDSSTSSAMNNEDTIDDSSAEKVWVKGTVERVMIGHDMLNITHEAIAAWNWPEMKMNFYLDESLNVEDFKQGQVLEFEIMVDGDGDNIITNVKGLINNEAKSSVNSVAEDSVNNEAKGSKSSEVHNHEMMEHNHD